MKVICENCHTGYDLPAGKEGVLGCPYCEHINVPKQTLAPAPTQIPEDAALDSSKTMLGPMDGMLEDESTKVREAIAGRKPGLPVNQEASLIIVDGDPKGKQIPLTKTRMILGRKAADIILNDAEASRQHCMIMVYDDFAIVKDLNSANGTKINERVIKEGVLKSGDALEIGTTLLRFTLKPRP